MFGWLRRFYSWITSLFWRQEMELTLIGLQNAGKTTLVNLLASGEFTENQIPTVGFNMKRVTKGKVTIKMWDLGGQDRFRTMWERYCRGVNVIVYVVDSSNRKDIELARKELLDLVCKPALANIPLLVLGNKNDLPDHMADTELIEAMGLRTITQREVALFSISAKNQTNIEVVMNWLIKHSTK
eukprot:gnl/Spiro4/3996_TR1988_c0_g1_i1.p1 gnl/Spiro4/3996_TR1988_c0_g1~~gnl/Spiro4/3996_TR1988_c0_g1_i1.p1  ORF type:complete len:203 (-),score=68.37 gnl/Spiro4/3996_TR1988_c0_g1_i1:203-754(-)